jgi:hypothetical protein
VDNTDSITFRKGRIGEFLTTLFLVPLGLICLICSPIAFVKLIHEGHHPLALAASAILAFALLMLFGCEGLSNTWVTSRSTSCVRSIPTTTGRASPSGRARESGRHSR